MITPESLEAMFILHGTHLRHLFGDLRYVVVDELHSFIGSERGRQLQSLLQRIELVLRRSVPRIALSATLGDMNLASEFLRPGGGIRVRRIISNRDPRNCEYSYAATRSVPMGMGLPGSARISSGHFVGRTIWSLQTPAPMSSCWRTHCAATARQVDSE